MKIIVIGGGASGIVASIFAKKDNNEVIVLEKNSKCLKKLLITGNGKCNYFNDDFSFEHYCSDSKVLNTFINEDNKEKVLDFFLSIGVVPRVRNGFYYPNSNQAYSVYNSLLKEASIRGVKVIYDTTVLNIVKKDKFIVSTNNVSHECDKVIISTGGKSYSKTGSTGDGYMFGNSFGHSVTDIYPGLVQLVSSDKFIKDLSGVRSDVCVSLYSDQLIRSEVGEIQFTDYGISGICVFNLSNYVGKLSNKCVKVNFFNSFDIDDVPSMIEFIDSFNKKVSNRSITELLEGFLNYKIVNTILKLCSIDSNRSWDSLSSFEKNELCKNLVSFNINIVDTKGYDNAQVTVGGICLDDIDINTFESKIVSGLYFAGEVLDVTGDCGGYNLGFAFLSGMIAGRSAGDCYD